MGRTLDAALSRGLPVPFTLDSVTYHWTPPSTCAPILSIILDGADGSDILDFMAQGMPKEQIRALRRRLGDPEDDLEFDTLQNILRRLVAEVAGRPWENIAHLTSLAAANWDDLDGETSHDLTDLPIDRFCNAVWRLFTKNMDEPQRKAFEGKVNIPIDGVEPSSEIWSDEATGNSFFAVAGNLAKTANVPVEDLIDPDGLLREGEG